MAWERNYRVRIEAFCKGVVHGEIALPHKSCYSSVPKHGFHWIGIVLYKHKYSKMEWNC